MKMQDQIQTITDRGILVMPMLSLWSGRKHVQPEELGVDLPKGVVTPGSKLIFPKDGVKPMETIKSKMMTVIEKMSVQYGRGVYLVDQDRLDELSTKLEDLRKEFNDEVANLEATYDRQFEDWLPTVNPPEWRDFIRRAKVPAAEAAGKYAFRYSLLRVSAPNDLPEANDEILTGLRGQLWEELADMAVAAQRGLMGKEKVSQRGKGPFKRICAKAMAVSFIDPSARKLAGYVESVLEKLPKTGPIEGDDLTTLQVLIHNLSDPHQAVSLARAFDAKDVGDAEGEEVLAGQDTDQEEAEMPTPDVEEATETRRFF